MTQQLGIEVAPIHMMEQRLVDAGMIDFWLLRAEFLSKGCGDQQIDDALAFLESADRVVRFRIVSAGNMREFVLHSRAQVATGPERLNTMPARHAINAIRMWAAVLNIARRLASPFRR